MSRLINFPLNKSRLNNFTVDQVINWDEQIYLNKKKLEWYGFQQGFLRTCLLLVDQVKGRRDAELFIIPIFYNLRHYIELVLKHSILQMNDILLLKETLANTAKTNTVNLAKISTSHDLKELIELFNYYSETIDYGILPEEAHNIIYDIHRIDPKGLFFRYPNINNDKFNIEFKGIFDLNKIEYCINCISNIFDGSISHLEVIRDTLCEDLYNKQNET